MKLKKIKSLDGYVKCSFCKNKTAQHNIQGYPYGGRTCCRDCFDNDESIVEHRNKIEIEDSLADERIDWMLL